MRNNPLRYNDPTGHCPWCISIGVGALLGAAVTYGVQVAANISQNGLNVQAFTRVNWKAVAAGTVAGAVGGATFGLGTAVLGTGAAGTIASGAISGAVAAQAAIATENALTGQAITEGLGRPEDILRDAAVGGFTAGMAYGVNALFSKPTTILSHYGDEIPPRVRPSFQEWQAVERKFSGGTRLYRIHGPGGAAGHWWLLELPSSEIQFRIDYAVRPEWNPVTHFSILEIPEGYSLKGLIGQAAYQGDFYVGGGMQVYLPKVPKEWISTYPWR